VTVDGVHYRTVRLDRLPVLDREGPDTKSNATITVIYAAPTDEFREDLWHAAILTLAGSLLLLAIATLVVAWAIRQGLSPLATLAVSAGKVSASDWNLNLPEDATATEELAPLTHAMETMLATLYRAFSSQQEFLANAAHELKTPVAILKSTLQSMVQVPRCVWHERNSRLRAITGRISSPSTWPFPASRVLIASEPSLPPVV
jgi:signal transduction histidine kinase